jgi:hypothetical protein
MRCTKCGAENPDSKHFCGDCGAAILAATEVPTSHLTISSARLSEFWQGTARTLLRIEKAKPQTLDGGL